MYVVLKMQTPIMISAAVLLVCGLILKRTWWDALKAEDNSQTIQTSPVNA